MLDHPSLTMLAQAAIDLKEPLREVLTLIMMFGFLFGTVLVISGALDIRHGNDEGGKKKIIAAAIIAGAPTIMKVLYTVFGAQGNLFSFILLFSMT